MEINELLDGIDEELRKEIEAELLAQYEKGRSDMASEHDARMLDESIEKALTKSGAYNVEVAKGVMNTDGISIIDGSVAGLSEEIDRLRSEYAFMFRQEHPQFVPDGSMAEEMDISSLNYLERLALFKENPDLYKLHMNK